jgi:signal transduction histidine kinase
LLPSGLVSFSKKWHSGGSRVGIHVTGDGKQVSAGFGARKDPGPEGSGDWGVVRAGGDGSVATNRAVVAAVALFGAIVVWALVNLLVEGATFWVIENEKVRGGEEAASALARLFGALVLGLFLADETGKRIRWVAAGLVVLGTAHLTFGYIEPTVQDAQPELNEALYEGWVAMTFACSLFALGLLPRTPPRPLVWAMTVVPAALVVGYIVVFELIGGEDWMPHLASVEETHATPAFESSFAWLTPWHWTIWTVPLALAMVALFGAFWQSRRGLLRGWLLFAMVLMAGSLLHEYLWPSSYNSNVVTTADILNLAFAGVVAIGGVVELRKVAAQRAALLADERERVRRLGELATLRADFSAMVAHELDGPIAAIRRLNEMLSADPSSDVLGYATGTIDKEIDALNALVEDVRDAATMERDDFSIETRPLALASLLTEAVAYANVLPGDHPVEANFDGSLGAGDKVMADAERIGQVLRNLLSNAAKYSPPGSPIEIRATKDGDRARIEVADNGPGIQPADVARVFEKFGRGRDQNGRKVPGVGLGLYLSRRIVRAHGSELTLETGPGKGSVFGISLEMAR